MASTISSTVNKTVVLGNGTYSASLTSSGDIYPSVSTLGSVYDGVTTDVTGASLTNSGTIAGSGGTANGTFAANGGVGVDLATAGDTINNGSGGSIDGGDGAGYVFGGATGTLAFNATYNAGNGGVGVVLDSSQGSLSNSQTIHGGGGGDVGSRGAGNAGNGGDGADLSGGAVLASNSFYIGGGSGGESYGSGGAGFGGAGIRLDAPSGKSYNSSNIEGGGGGQGGSGHGGGAGGTGAILTSAYLYSSSGFIEGGAGGGGGSGKAGGAGGGGALLTAGSTLVNAGSVRGGGPGANTGGGGYGISGYGVKATDSTVTNQSRGGIYGATGALIYGGSFSNAGRVDGSAGGVGAYLSDTTSEANTNSGTLFGGNGSGTGLILSGSYLKNTDTIKAGDGVESYSSATKPGSGGIGVYLKNGSTLENSGTIYGGDGGGALVDQGGQGSAGVKVVGGSTLDSSGTIYGGTSGTVLASSATTAFSNAGVGVDLLSGTVNDSGGSIVGGRGFEAGNGGAGIYLNASGTLKNLSGAGSIIGGYGGASTSQGGSYSYSPAGAGGDGIDMGHGASLTLGYGTVTGGAGGAGYYRATLGAENAAVGGTGISVASGATVTIGSATNAVNVTGGPGGRAFNVYSSGGGTPPTGAKPAAGGSGMLVDDGTASVVSGTITGGTGGSVFLFNKYESPVSGDVNGADGGAGIYLSGSGSVTAGAGATFKGGSGGTVGDMNTGAAGAVGDAVQFAASASTTGSLVIDPGATFSGAVYGGHGGGADSDLILAGTTRATLSGGLGTQFTEFNHLTFDAGSIWMVDAVSNAAGGITSLGNIYGFVAGDTIDLTDLTLNPLHSAVFAGGKLTVINGTTTVMFNIDENPGTMFTLTAASAGGGIDITTTATVACYLRSTHIMTETGDVAIEKLRIGDLVLTADGSYKPIRWIGKRAYGREFAGRDVLPVLIRAGALADHVPRRNLYVSPQHGMLIDGLLVAAVDLVNGASILQIHDLKTIEYFHVELDAHDILLAEGAESESFVDDDSRMMFHNAHEYQALYPGAVSPPSRFCAPRVSEGFELESIRSKIRARALQSKAA